MDIVVFGATGYTGRLVAGHLARHAPAGTVIGLAGRSRRRLEEVRADLGVDWPVVVADAEDPRGLAGGARVVVSTVGPYRRHGLPLAEACARAGTHLADLSGEVLHVRASIDRCDGPARASGARIVHGCGFDAVPSDLGVLALHEEAGEPLTDTTMLVRELRGGISGGTLASAGGQLDEVRRSAAQRRIVADPYALSPGGGPAGAPPDVFAPHRDAALGTWLAPFVMASFNTRIVRRSAALREGGYGAAFRYGEAVATGGGPLGAVRAAGLTAGLGVLGAGLALAPVRGQAARVVGEGPGERTRERGRLRLETHTRTASGRRLVCRIAAEGDPGYAATAVMLGESALCLAADALPGTGGVLTPASAMGTALLARLRARGHRYDVAPA